MQKRVSARANEDVSTEKRKETERHEEVLNVQVIRDSCRCVWYGVLRIASRVLFEVRHRSILCVRILLAT